MKTMKYLYSFCLFLVMSVGVFAQADGLSVKRFDDVSTIKQYARTQPKRDSNGDYAALVLVQVLADVKVDFTGAYLLGDVEKKASESWVYMAAGAKSLEVHCTGFEKLKVDFADVSKGTVPSLVKQCTYELVVSVPGVVHMTQTPQRQFFKFRVTPKKDAWVTVWENGEQQTLTLNEEGMARKMFNYGTYKYMVSADRYHSQEGTFTVTKTPGELVVALQPQFGWLTINGDAVTKGAHVFATNTVTGRKTQLGTIPMTQKEIDGGVYTLQIQQEKYKDYSTTVTIAEGKTTVISPQLEANFAQLTLTTQSGADIYVDGRKLGTGRWSGTLELGEYSVETRQASHKSSYTNLSVLPQTAGKTIVLNDPLPIYGSLIVDGTPMDAVVYVDNKRVGVSPLVYGELLIGSHTMRLEKEGYAKQEKTIVVSEGQEHMLEYTLAKETPKPMPTDKETFTVNGVSFTMVAVKGGTFTMGGTAEQGSDEYDWEKPTHQVTLSDYMIGETEVTQELWKAVMGSNPSYFSGTNLPVERVSWDDCQTFITKLNQLTGRNFRLPTEAEWEYAARGGQKSKGYKYAGSNTLSDVAWYKDNSWRNPHPVKQKQANELGLYDMSGNVWEWCQDWWGSYSSSAQTNPTGPSSGSIRVYRGGGWSGGARDCRVSDRFNYTPSLTYNYLGLRVVLLP